MYPELCPKCRTKVDKALKEETAAIFKEMDEIFAKHFAKYPFPFQDSKSSNNEKDLETPLNNSEISTNCLE